MADATLDFWDSLNDPTKYKVTRGVPVFCPHERAAVGKDGKPFSRVVTDEDLKAIAMNMASRQAQSGTPARITEGHIAPDPKVPESQQPGLIGFAANPRFGHFGPTRMPGVITDHFIRLDRLAAANNLPFRSAEYYPDQKLITGVALLVRDPQLPMGAVTYQLSDQVPELYAMDAAGSPAGMPNQQPEQFSPEETQLFERMMKYLLQKQASMCPTPEQPPAAAAQPRGNPMAFDATTQPELYALQQENEKQKADNVALQTRLAAIEKDRQIEKCARLLDQLEKVERYQFDRAVEMETFVALDDAGRAKRADYIRKYYSPAPGTAPIEVYSGDAGPIETGPMAAPKNHDKVMLYMRAHPGMTYNEAEANFVGK